jgi:cellulose synthase/poly-beta-1,6-N-acetylglucosamine synthase-like glycosyltransferase
VLVIVEFWGYLRLEPVQNIDTPSVLKRRSDVTVVAVTLGTEPQYVDVIRGWLRADPKAIVITTIDAQLPSIKALVQSIGDARISVYSVKTPSNRRQYYQSISRVETPFFVIADDRSRWGISTLDDILSPFQDPQVGGVTGMQVVKPRNSQKLGLWESFGALNLMRRNVQHSALTFFNNGQVLNLSGRLSAFRTSIFKDPRFQDHFLNDVWLGRFPITTGDDNALTTWVVRKGWGTWFQNSPGVTIAGGVCPDRLYAKQLLRWLRDTTRSYLRDLAFALETGQRKLLLRAALNLIVYFITDAATVLELGFFISLSVFSTLWGIEMLWLG